MHQPASIQQQHAGRANHPTGRRLGANPLAIEGVKQFGTGEVAGAILPPYYEHASTRQQGGSV